MEYNHANRKRKTSQKSMVVGSKVINKVSNHQKSDLTSNADLLQHLVVPAFVIDRECKVRVWNRACERLTGLNASEVLGTSDHWKAFYPVPRPCLADIIMKGLEDKLADFYSNYSTSTEVELGIKAANWCVMPQRGTRLYLEIDAGPIYSEDGQLIAVVETLRDMTERKNNEIALKENSEKLNALYELSPLGIALTDMNGKFIDFNESFRQICGYPEHELKNIDYWQLTPKKFQDDEANQLESLQRTGHYGPYEKEYLRKDGTLVPLCLNGLMLTDHSGQNYIWSIVENISERKQAMANLRESEQRFRQMFEGHSAVMLLIEPELGMIVDANPAASDFYGYPLGVLRGMLLSSINSSSETEIKRHIQHVNQGKQKHFVFDHRLANGQIRTVEVYSSPVTFMNRQLLFSIIHDITERKLAEARIHNLAFFDALTQLPNRRLLNDRLDQSIASCKRSGRYGALMFLDLDNFKPLNDTYGHKVGDLLLIEAARRISGCIRETDTAARFGGDEFVVVLKELATNYAESATQASMIAEKIRSALSEPYLLTVKNDDSSENIVEHHCTSSIGIAVYNDTNSRDAVLKWSDMAMYDAKNAGRNHVVVNQQIPNRETAAD